MLQFISTLLARFSREDEEGQTLVEYGLLLALIAIIVIVALLFLGPIVSQIFSNVAAEPSVGQRRQCDCAPGLRPGGVFMGTGFRAGPPTGRLRSATPGPQFPTSTPFPSPQVQSNALDAVRRLLTAVTMLRGLIHIGSTPLHSE